MFDRKQGNIWTGGNVQSIVRPFDNICAKEPGNIGRGEMFKIFSCLFDNVWSGGGRETLVEDR